MQYWGMTLRHKPKKLIFNSSKKTKTVNGRNNSTVSHFSATASLKASRKEDIFCLPEHLHVRTTDTRWVHVHVGTLSKDHNVNAINLNRDRNDNLLKKP